MGQKKQIMETLYYVQKGKQMTIYSIDTQSMKLVIHSEHTGIAKMITALARLRVEGYDIVEL